MARCQSALRKDSALACAMALDGSVMRRRNPIITVRQLTLRIPAGRKGENSIMANPFSLLASFYMPSQQKREVRTILDDVSFDVEEGNRLALIGRNGAGKTTLLRVLAGSVSPSRGTITTRGTVQALLNVNLGLRDQATGLENIYLRGLSMGMTLHDIRKRVPDIVAFSELGDAIYDPIQTYSAGMRARLAFSIVTSRAPNVLLMDEWITTGDSYFVEKAQQRLEAQVEVCRALVLASHSKSTISEICTHGLVLESGRKIFLGKIDDALKFYDEMKPHKAAMVA
jgi:ABC-type polysaccharide/polyol phosphate transport system ATPase subunit